MTNSQITFVREEIINTIVKKWIVGDIKRLLDIKPDPSYDGNCNFPIALYVLSCMDFLGYLIAENKYSLNGRDTKKRVLAYIDTTFSSHAKEEIEPHKNEFVKKFRHGLAHEFFPKMSGISRENQNLMSTSKEGYWVLDADILAKMFIESVKTLEIKTSNNDFCLRIYERYDEMQKNNLSLRNKPLYKSTLNIRATGATTTTLPYQTMQGYTGPSDQYSKADTGPSMPPPSKGDTGVKSQE